MRRLSAFSDFTDKEVITIIDACLDNSQILQIIKDPDVEAFVLSLIQTRSGIIDDDKIEALMKSLISDDDSFDESEAPF